jgi:hypothetical protein
MKWEIRRKTTWEITMRASTINVLQWHYKLLPRMKILCRGKYHNNAMIWQDGRENNNRHQRENMLEYMHSIIIY